MQARKQLITGLTIAGLVFGLAGIAGAQTGTSTGTSTGTGATTTPPVATTTPATTTPPVMQKGEWKLNVGDGNGKVLLRGNVMSVGQGMLTVKSWGGTWTVKLNAGAEVLPKVLGVNGDLSKFMIGDYVGVQGFIAPNETLVINAHTVRNWTERRELKDDRKENLDLMKQKRDDDKKNDQMTGKIIEGTATAVASSSYTVAHDGKVTTVVTTSATKFVNKNWNTISASDIQVGDKIRAFGNLSSTTLTAEVVRDVSIPR